MLNYLDEMSVEDRRASFLNTYIKVRYKDAWRAARCIDFYDNNVRVIIPNYGEHTIPVQDVDVSMPDLGMFWWEGRLLYVSRQAERQWRRGLRCRGLVIHQLEENGRSSTFRNTSSSFVEAMSKAFLEGHFSHECILTRDFARKGKLLYFRTIPVGRFTSPSSVKLFFKNIPEIEGIVYEND